MSSINKVILIGNLGADPEVKATPSGKQVANLRLATSWGSGDSEKTEWHSVILWDKLAEIAGKFAKKGSKVYIEGRIETRTWDKDGVKQYKTEIVGSELRLLSPKSEAFQEPTEPATPPASRRRAKPAPQNAPQDDSDLEF